VTTIPLINKKIDIKVFLNFCTLILLLVFLCANPSFSQKRKKKNKKLQQTESLSEKKEIEANFYFSEGMRYGLKEEYDKAAKYYEKSLSIMPGNAAIHFKLGECYSNLADLDKAQKHAVKAVELDHSNEYYYILLARIYQYQNNFTDAIKTYLALIENVQGSESNYYDLALLQVMRSDWQGALTSYGRIQEFFGPSLEISNQKQKIYLKLNRLEDAIREGRQLIEDFPENPEYVITLAVLLNSNNRSEGAEKLLDSLLQEQPNLSAARLVLFEILRDQGKKELAYEQIFLAFSDPTFDVGQKAGLLAGFSRYASSEKEKDQSLELALLLVKVHPGSDLALSIVGDVYLERENKTEALKYYHSSIKINSSSFSVWMNILILNFEESNYDSLVHYSEQMIEYYPNNSRVWFLQGLGYYSLKDYEKAKFSLEMARKWGAKEEDLLVDIEATLGDTYNNLGEYENSDDAYDAVLTQNPNNDHVLNNYSYFLSLRKEHLDKALIMSSKLAKDYPDNSTYLDTHAWVLFQLEKYEEALPFLERAVKNSDSGVIHEHLGDVLFKLGKKDQAMKSWKKAKELGDAGDFLDKKIETGKWHE
jgi:tetratricopeptide (TPR) repeat protein